MSRDCFMIRIVRSGGGGNLRPQRITVRRSAAIGDAIACTIVADKLKEMGMEVAFQTWGGIHAIMKRIASVDSVEVPAGFVHVNLDGAYEKHPLRCQRHFYGFFMDAARGQLQQHGITLGPAVNCRPRITVTPASKQVGQKMLDQYPRPWVFICPRSENYTVRQVPDHIWGAAAKLVKGTKFWIGLHPAPPGIIDLRTHNIGMVADWLSVADLLISVDTGPMHIANAVGTQVLALGQSSSPELHLSDQTDFMTIEPPLDCLNCQLNVCPKSPHTPPCQTFDPEYIAHWANLQLDATQTEKISCVIPILRPRAEVLNRCLQAVIPQVHEIIITHERGGIVPRGTLTDPKIRVVVKQAEKIGFGRNVNFGFRHTSGKYVLVLNDDVYLAPDAVARMMECMKPKTGVVGQLLRYPDGTIYHAGKLRMGNGGIGFPHVDHRKAEASIKAPMEMENTNGASFLFRRKAFYDADGYDDAFFFYAEDDDICMKIRKAGWSVWYTPLATGIHDEHQESRNMPERMAIMQQSNARFGQKWAKYFQHNLTNPGLGNFDYLRTTK